MVVEEWDDHRIADDAEGQQRRDRSQFVTTLLRDAALGDENSSDLE